MYNDEKNLYHYTYRKSGREEPARDESPVQDPAPTQSSAPAQDANPSIESQLHDFQQSEQQIGRASCRERVSSPV